MAASDKVVSMLNRDHVEHEADEKIAEITAATHGRRVRAVTARPFGWCKSATSHTTASERGKEWTDKNPDRSGNIWGVGTLWLIRTHGSGLTFSIRMSGTAKDINFAPVDSAKI